MKSFVLSNLADFQLALRNTLRHRVRTSIALAAIGFGITALLLAGGFIESLLVGMRETTIESRLGHIQIVKSGYMTSGVAEPFAYLLPDKVLDFASIKHNQNVKVIASRLNFSGLISHGETTFSFIGEGVEPAKEEKLSKALSITQGAGLSANDKKGIIVGEGLALNLGVKPGDKVVLLANTKSGGINGIEVYVKGLFSTFTKSFDDSAIRVPVETARELLRINGSHSLVLLLIKN